MAIENFLEKKMDKAIDLSVIIVSSKKDYLFDCLRTLMPALKNLASEIILVDNASADKIGNLVKEKYPEVVVLRREENGGFGENNNMGLKIARGKYILLLNDDTKLIDGKILEEMIAWMDARPKVGVSSCALLNSDQKTYQGSGGFYPTLGRVFAWMTFIDDIPGLGRLIKSYHPKDFTRVRRQDWVTGAFFLIRKEALDEVGYFDEDFFLYVEEVDLAARFIRKGWEVWYLPKWNIVHYGQSTTGSEKATIFELQNLILMYKKHESAWKVPVLRLILKTGVFLRIVIWRIIGKRDLSKIYAKAFNSI